MGFWLTLLGHGKNTPDLLPSQTVKKCDNFLKSFEFVAAKFDGGSHEILAGLGVDEVIAVEKVLLVGEDDMVVGWHR